MLSKILPCNADNFEKSNFENLNRVFSHLKGKKKVSCGK